MYACIILKYEGALYINKAKKNNTIIEGTSPHLCIFCWLQTSCSSHQHFRVLHKGMKTRKEGSLGVILESFHYIFTPFAQKESISCTLFSSCFSFLYLTVYSVIHSKTRNGNLSLSFSPLPNALLDGYSI